MCILCIVWPLIVAVSMETKGFSPEESPFHVRLQKKGWHPPPPFTVQPGMERIFFMFKAHMIQEKFHNVGPDYAYNPNIFNS